MLVVQMPCKENGPNMKTVVLCTNRHSAQHNDEIHTSEDTPSLVKKVFFQDSYSVPSVNNVTQRIHFLGTNFKSKTVCFVCIILYNINLWISFASTVGHYWSSFNILTLYKFIGFTHTLREIIEASALF